METPQVRPYAMAQTSPPPPAPHGLPEIITTFGDIRRYIDEDGQLDPGWQLHSLARITLPFPLPLAWDPARSISRMTCHRRMTGIFGEVFSRIQERGLRSKLTSFGGCFAFRTQRTGSKLSTHSWGIAIDVNPESNAQGSVGNMDAGLVELFHAAGFKWGGDWEGPARDPMHFQFCTGY